MHCWLFVLRAWRNAMENRQCVACGQSFCPRPQAPKQSYCSAAACQRERRRLWQKSKRQTDPDYRDNQRRAQQAWCARHPDYWHNYRSSHPGYVERNRAQQRERNGSSPRGKIAKMDASMPIVRLPEGIYQIVQLMPTQIAKKDVWTIEITLLSETSREFRRLQREDAIGPAPSS